MRWLFLDVEIKPKRCKYLIWKDLRTAASPIVDTRISNFSFFAFKASLIHHHVSWVARYSPNKKCPFCRKGSKIEFFNGDTKNWESFVYQSIRLCIMSLNSKTTKTHRVTSRKNIYIVRVQNRTAVSFQKCNFWLTNSLHFTALLDFDE